MFDWMCWSDTCICRHCCRQLLWWQLLCFPRGVRQVVRNYAESHVREWSTSVSKSSLHSSRRCLSRTCARSTQRVKDYDTAIVMPLMAEPTTTWGSRLAGAPLMASRYVLVSQCHRTRRRRDPRVARTSDRCRSQNASSHPRC